MFKKKILERDPNKFFVVKPEKPKPRVPKLFKILFILLIVLFTLFIVWELYQVYELNSDIEEPKYSETESNLQQGSIFMQDLNYDNKFNKQLLDSSTIDGISYKTFFTKTEYEKVASKIKNIKQLTDKDFERFYVIIAYKPNSILTLNNRFFDKHYDNIIFSAEDNVEDKLLLVALPKQEKAVVNIVLKRGDKEIIQSQLDIYEIINKNLDKFTDYFSKKYFQSSKLENASILIKNIKLVNSRANEFFITNGENQQETGEISTYWQAYVYLEQNNTYYLRVLIDSETGKLVGAYDY